MKYYAQYFLFLNTSVVVCLFPSSKIFLLKMSHNRTFSEHLWVNEIVTKCKYVITFIVVNIHVNIKDTQSAITLATIASTAFKTLLMLIIL